MNANALINHPKVFRSDEEGIARAIEVLSQGGVAILPADTVYGFFASAVRQPSVERVYQIKNREKRKPFVIYTNEQKVRDIVHMNVYGEKLVTEAWPKALSLILQKQDIIPDWFTNNQSTLAVMTAQNKVVSRVIAEVSEPILGTTCNLSGEPEMKTAEEVFQFIDQVDILIADDSIPIYNKPSTMIDCTVNPPKIARLSSLTLEELQEIIPELDIDLSRRFA
ncbi:L-threonylcarbamoyladenylate synthase [Paenibacillus sp. MMS18-CY102]|uniref:L-threonylcarbamoyladenylate synthase n=1 Tax=Paenibacillus sp. MMS18-CY102 TaxID=2682849 RepID=UPI0013654CAF|nr:L-threonylcarbamoyladenylate synthase [Paenibacillus sp. MMS18-CY102]MWC26879.1 threonylcarbamoyl-AMP synthase [Paenibacillus sp. MMS18-CY102]